MKKINDRWVDNNNNSWSSTLNTEEQFIRLLDEAKAEKSEADQILADAKSNRDEIEQECNERLERVAIKEEKVQFDLQANENVAQINKAKELELKNKELEFNAKYKILLSSIKSNGKSKRKTR